MSRACLFVLASILLGATALSQQNDDASASQRPLKLAIADRLPIHDVTATAMLLPLRCDSDGNYYVRFFHGRSPMKEPIYKFGHDGSKLATFTISSDPDLNGGTDFAIGKNGEVYQLSDTSKGTFVALFSKDGPIRKKIKLSAKLDASRIEVFESGELLIVGVEQETEANPEPHRAYSAIFDGDGKLLRRITEENDKNYEEAAKRGDDQFFDRNQGGGGNFAISRGNVVQGSDGNVYVLRWTTPARVFVVSPAGQILRSFTIDPGPGLEHKKPAGFHENRGRLAVQFEGDRFDPTSVIRVVSLTGDDYTTYDSTGLGVAFACYLDQERFAFLRADGETLTVNLAQPR
jgi:hypothetical protein